MYGLFYEIFHRLLSMQFHLSCGVLNTYTCYFETGSIPDEAVTLGTSCNALPGTVTFNSATGVLDWTTSTESAGVYEIKIEDNIDSAGSDEEVFYITVREP